MIKTSRLIVDFDRKWSPFADESNISLDLVDKLSILNEALQIVFENRVLVAESDAKVVDDLRKLKKDHFKLSQVEINDEFSVYEIPDDAYKIMRYSITVEKDGCDGSKRLFVIVTSSDDLETSRKNYWKSSYAWETVIINKGSKGINVWHDSDFRIVDFRIDFYKKPEELHSPKMAEDNQYEDWNGVLRTKEQDLQLDSTYIHRLITNVAVLIARVNMTDYSSYQVDLNKLLNIDKIKY